MLKDDYKIYEEKMNKSIDSAAADFASVRAGRANAAVLDRIMVDYYGTPTPIQQIAAISTPDPRILQISPWEGSALKSIEKAILNSDLGINPQNDGRNIRLNFPQLTEERRKELVKQIRKYAENGKVAIRNTRRDAMESFKKKEKASEITEDDLKQAEKDLQKLTDDSSKKIDELLARKEKVCSTLRGGLEKGWAASPPRHIAIIMDGNGRWATQRGLPRTAGHKAGAETFRRIATYCKNIGVKYLTVYAFSTENWKRSETEVSAIMALLKKYLLEAVDTMERDHIRLHFFGDMTPIAPELRALAHETDEITEHLSKDDFQANVCLNYGGRDEILRAVHRFAAECAEGKRKPEDLDETLFSTYLDSAGIPDPELIIRPSGEQRLSNFLLWQCAYSEFYYTDTLWPDFDEEELDKAIAAYQSRDRRFGGVKK